MWSGEERPDRSGRRPVRANDRSPRGLEPRIPEIASPEEKKRSLPSRRNGGFWRSGFKPRNLSSFTLAYVLLLVFENIFFYLRRVLSLSFVPRSEAQREKEITQRYTLRVKTHSIVLGKLASTVLLKIMEYCIQLHW